MTAQILQSELTSLIQDSKRKNAELRSAAEKSLQDLKSLPTTSEKQLAADLQRKAGFADAFLIACRTRNARFTSSGVSCLQRLIAFGGLPSSRLDDVLKCLREATSLGFDVQLKVLQALPPLLQNYSQDLHSELLARTLEVSSILQNVKNIAVSSTAAATLQQLITSVLEKVAAEDARSKNERVFTATIEIDDESLSVAEAAHDAYRLFNDLCLLAEGEKAEFVPFAQLPQSSCMELIESVLKQYTKVVHAHSELLHVCRQRLMPFLTRCLSEKHGFPQTVRTMRLVSIIFKHYFNPLASECEIPLGLLNHMLETDVVPGWKRCLCMEIFKEIFEDPRLFLRIFAVYGHGEESKPLIRDTLASFVRLSTEKPAKIGLGHHSTMPSNQSNRDSSGAEQAVAEAAGAVGVFGATVGVAEVNVPGISTEWSLLKMPLLSQVDKAEASAVPETYVYSLVLTCISQLTDGLARVVLPLAMHAEGKAKRKQKLQNVEEPLPSPGLDSDTPMTPGRPRAARSASFRKRTIPFNPLDAQDHPFHAIVHSGAAFIEDCWPAVLATCSTFLNAALDAEFYRALVRSMQKFTHVAGLLRLMTPRDAFLTTLGKSAVPSSLLNANNPASPIAESPSHESGIFAKAPRLFHTESFGVQDFKMLGIQARTDTLQNSLSARNLLCLRALLNLAIALGPTLNDAWTIIFRTLQDADVLLASERGSHHGGEKNTGSRGDAESQSEATSIYTLDSEISAVSAATLRLFESTGDYPDPVFQKTLYSICLLLRPRVVLDSPPSTKRPSRTPSISHSRQSSTNTITGTMDGSDARLGLALTKLKDISLQNASRFCANESDDSGWTLFSNEISRIIASSEADLSVRSTATSALREVAVAMTSTALDEEEDVRETTQARLFEVLRNSVHALLESETMLLTRGARDAHRVIHEQLVHILKEILDGFGQTIKSGWSDIFVILRGCFRPARGITDSGMQSPTKGSVNDLDNPYGAEFRSERLGRSAFQVLQLLCSEDLEIIPESHNRDLVFVLLLFSGQNTDINITLTTMSVAWNLSDFLRQNFTENSLDSLSRLAADNEDAQFTLDTASASLSPSALWLSLLRRMAELCSDTRAEVCNSAVNTVLRILDAEDLLLSPDGWALCFRVILMYIIELDIRQQKIVRESSEPSRTILNERAQTCENILSNFSTLFVKRAERLSESEQFPDLWDIWMTHVEDYLSFETHDINAAVFAALRLILSEAKDSFLSDPSFVDRAAGVWARAVPTQIAALGGKASNQPALFQYVHTFDKILSITSERLSGGQIKRVLENFETCIEDSACGPYVNDEIGLTDLQKVVIDTSAKLPSNVSAAPRHLFTFYSRMAGLAFVDADNEKTDRSTLSFIALTKISMSHLKHLVEKHPAEAVSSAVLIPILQQLRTPIALKYAWIRQGRGQPLWQSATESALAILECVLSLNTGIDELIRDSQFWDEISGLGRGIVGARCDDLARHIMLTDEDFDMKALRRYHALVVPLLGAADTVVTARTSYAALLFEFSLLHALGPGEFLSIMLSAPLEQVPALRHGRTYDPPPCARQRLAYLCLELLKVIVAAPDSDTSSDDDSVAARSARLTHSAFPFLVLRFALPIKAYIVDQPLRGRMPQPGSEKEELLHVLRQLSRQSPHVDSDTAVDTGTAQAPGALVPNIAPLVVRALSVAHQVPGGADRGVLRALLDVLRSAPT